MDIWYINQSQIKVKSKSNQSQIKIKSKSNQNQIKIKSKESNTLGGGKIKIMNVSGGWRGGERGSNPQKWAEGLGKSGGKGSNWQATPSLAMLPLCGTIVWGNVAKRLLPAGCSLWGWLSQTLREIFGGYWTAPLPLFRLTDTIQSLNQII